MLFSVLIVDSKDYIRKGIIQKLLCRFDNLTITGEAGDGEEALLKTEALHPDIVILDFQLAKIDGFTYMEQVLARHLHTHFILISEFDNFSYVQHALRLGIHDYLLKPLNNQDLYAAVDAACLAIQQERQRLLGRLPAEKAAFFIHRCTAWYNATKSEMTNDRLCRAMADNFLMPFPGPYFSFFALRIMPSPAQAAYPEVLPSVKYAISCMVTDYLCHCGVIQCFYHPSPSADIFCIVNHIAEKPQLQDALTEALHQIYHVLHWECICSVSTACRHFSSLKEKCTELEEMLSQSVGLPNVRVIQKQDLRGLSAEAMEAEPEQIIELVGLLQSNSSSTESANQLVGAFLQGLVDSRKNRSAIIRSCELFWQAASRELNRMLQMPESALQELDTEQFQDCLTLDDFRKRLLNSLLELNRQYETNHLSAGKKIVAAIKARLETEYDKNIKLSFFAATYYINQSYLSALFQQETGVNYSQYLTNIRLQKAKELLDTTNYSTGKIAEMVGYNDRNYFASVFSKKNGMTPMQYRASKTE